MEIFKGVCSTGLYAGRDICTWPTFLLPAVHAAIERFEEQQSMGHGDQDFSSIFVFRNKG